MVAMKAGVNFRAAVKYLETTKMPSDMKKLRHWRTRNDPFAAVWLEVTALFSAKQYAGTLPDWHHERYLLGIARNVAYRREDERTYQQLLRLRTKAGDLIFDPLVKSDDQLATTLSRKAHRKALLNLTLDRFFWRRRFLELFQALPQTERHEEGRWCTRLTACRMKLPHKERDHFIALLAGAAAPLAA
jgi:hypothetical protein